jgi:hypothetical protein
MASRDRNGWRTYRLGTENDIKETYSGDILNTGKFTRKMWRIGLYVKNKNNKNKKEEK